MHFFSLCCGGSRSHVVSQFQDAQNVNINGNPRFTNIGLNVNNYGGIHGLENLKESVSFPALYNSAEQDPHRRCHPGTRENVLRQLRHWIDNPNPKDRIFWLYGPAGAGKSAIAQTIAHGYTQGQVAATFFFYRSDSGRNDGNRLFTTIAWQLAFSIPSVKDLIVDALDKTPHLPTSDVETQFKELIAQPMNHIASQMPHPAPVIIIDGVDECSKEQLQRRFLAVIGNTVKGGGIPLRFLICSRPEVLIEETLKQFKDFTLRIDLATLDDSNRDIEKYLVDKFSDIACKQGLGTSWPGQEIIEEIVFKSSGNFILASTLIRFIADEDYSAVSQLDIVLKLKPRGTMSPFALLDELYLEILNRQKDQDFLKTFLALLVGRSSIDQNHLDEDDAILMNVSQRELHIKLRRMRSLLKLEPFVNVYHKSFFDFLQDLSRSGHYHITKEGGQVRYLKLIVNAIVSHISMAIEQPDCHESCCFDPTFRYVAMSFPPKFDLPLGVWQEALKPLLDFQDKLLKTLSPRPCHVSQVMRDLLLHLAILQRITSMSEPLEDNTITLATEARETIHGKDLDGRLSTLLACLQKTELAVCHSSVSVDKPIQAVMDPAIIDHISSLLAFDSVEIAARLRSVSDAQKLIDFIDLMSNNKLFLNQCGPDARRRAACLASEILARIPLLPRSLPLNGPSDYDPKSLTLPLNNLELACHTVLISRILDHSYIVPVSEIYTASNRLWLVGKTINKHNELLSQWLEGSNPNFFTRIRVMLEVAKSVRYLHSMEIALHSNIFSTDYFALDSNYRAKILPFGFFKWWIRVLIYRHDTSYGDVLTHESNVSAFANLFDQVCFLKKDVLKQPSHVEGDARDLIERCQAKDPKRRPTMDDIVKEMETWNLTYS